VLRTTRFVAVIAFIAAALPASVGYTEGAADGPSYALPGRHVVDRWFLEQSTSPLDVQQRYFNAVERGDAAGATAAFSANAVYHGGGCQPDPCVGLAAIEQEIVRTVADGAHTTMRYADVEGNQLIWSGDLVSDAVRAAGFDYVTAMGSMRVDGDEIVDYRVWPDITDPVTGLYIQRLEPAYQRAPAAPEPDTKHALD
jgi:ketosteroid isomerase-like protein